MVTVVQAVCLKVESPASSGVDVMVTPLAVMDSPAFTATSPFLIPL